MRAFILTTHRARHPGDCSPEVRISTVVATAGGAVESLAAVARALSKRYDPALLKKSSVGSTVYTYRVSGQMQLVVSENADAGAYWE